MSIRRFRIGQGTFAHSHSEVDLSNRQARRGVIRTDCDDTIRVSDEAKPHFVALLHGKPRFGQPTKVQLVCPNVHSSASSPGLPVKREEAGYLVGVDESVVMPSVIVVAGPFVSNRTGMCPTDE